MLFGAPRWLSQLSITLLIWSQVMIPVVRLSPVLGSALSVQPDWYSLSPSAPLSGSCSLKKKKKDPCCLNNTEGAGILEAE